ncbi:MAG TPA: SpoIIE family protein phosphatase [Solirubrobacteraceae bacterium]|nr:SpoIIE family protein phosphatase [Solirubrobacteraceae bacterium]
MPVTLTEQILDRAPNAVVAMDDSGRVTYWNPRAEELFGFAREDAIGRAVADLILPERYRAAHREGVARFLADGTGPLLERKVEIEALHADGTEFPVELTVSAVRDGDRWNFHAFVADISGRRETEQQRDSLVEELRVALDGSERRFETVVGSFSDPVTIRDRNDRIVYANRAALQSLGFDSTEDLRETPPRDIMADYVVSGDDGRSIAMEDIPSVRLLRGLPAEPLLIRTIHRHTGAQRWQLLKSAPLRGADRDIEATITVIEDVTEQKRAERQSAFLAQVSAALASSLDYEQTLRNVAQLAVPEFVDWCAVDLRDEDGDRRPVAVAHADPQRLKLAEKMRNYERIRLNPNEGIGLVFRTGRSVLYPKITDEWLVKTAADERHLELLREVGLRSVAVVPMAVGNRILGAMTLVNAESGRVLDEFDLKLAEQVADRAAVAIENARLYSERSSIAHTLQQSLLPEQLPQIPGFELASAYIPAFESTEVGGDFYDVWELEDGWMLIIGDVTGKGIEAAALTSLVRHTMRAASEFESSPAALLARVDSILKKQRARSICTALCMRLFADRALLAAGGHPLPLHVSSRGVGRVGEHGPLLGGFTDVSWHDTTVDLEPDSILVAYTDGVTDAIGADGTRYGLQRLCDTLAHFRGRSATEVIEGLTVALGEFQIGTHADDTAALVLRRRGRLVTERDGQGALVAENLAVAE